MKNRFLKSVLALSAVLAFVSCSEETANAINNLDPQATQPTDENPNLLPADEPCWLVKADQQYLIYSAGIVTDINGNVVGTITFIDVTLTGSIVGIDGSMILEKRPASPHCSEKYTNILFSNCSGKKIQGISGFWLAELFNFYK